MAEGEEVGGGDQCHAYGFVISRKDYIRLNNSLSLFVFIGKLLAKNR
jgi:hypothetical protein